MPKLVGLDQKFYDFLKKPEQFPDELKSWLTTFIARNQALRLNKSTLTGILGENWKNVGAGEDVAYGGTPSWQDYGGGYGGARFYKDYLNIVHLEGLVTPAVNPGSTIIFSLPAGYRPLVAQMFLQQGHNGAYVPCRIDVLTNGDVQIVNPANTTFTGVAANFISLAGITFRAA